VNPAVSRINKIIKIIKRGKKKPTIIHNVIYFTVFPAPANVAMSSEQNQI